MATLANEHCLLVVCHYSKALKGFIQWINPVGTDVQLGQFLSV
jgi:hypothetical protein